MLYIYWKERIGARDGYLIYLIRKDYEIKRKSNVYRDLFADRHYGYRCLHLDGMGGDGLRVLSCGT